MKHLLRMLRVLIPCHSIDRCSFHHTELNDGTSNSSPFDIYAIDNPMRKLGHFISLYLYLWFWVWRGIAPITDNDPPKVILSVDTTATMENGDVAVQLNLVGL